MDSATSSISVDDLQSVVGKTFTSYEELENFIDEIETAINLVISVVDNRTIEVGTLTLND
jgi:predicted DNA-binding ArsR family transcriptional regulator